MHEIRERISSTVIQTIKLSVNYHMCRSQRKKNQLYPLIIIYTYNYRTYCAKKYRKIGAIIQNCSKKQIGRHTILIKKRV